MHNIAIPFIAVLIAFAGSGMTRANLPWYKTIKKPSWTPPGSVIGIVWTIIYVLTSASALIVWNLYGDLASITVSMLFLANSALNVGWSYIFFVRHALGLAIIEMCLLNVTTIALMYIIWPLSTLAALLLLPYVLWVIFATYLAVRVKLMNP